jgi:hypothetical protein
MAAKSRNWAAGDNAGDKGKVSMKTMGLVLLTLAISIAPANAVDLTCGGSMHTYNPKHIEGTVAPQATVVNLEEKYIATPVGEFDITKVSEDSISFGGTSPSYPGLTIFGTLDRVTGHMTVFWRKPGDTSHMAMYSELNCSKAKRLF